MRVPRLASCTSLEAENIQNPNDHYSVNELVLLNNAIALGDFEAAQDVPMELTKQERLDYSNEPQPEQFCFLLSLSSITCSTFSRSASSWRGNSGTVECMKLYWFSYVIGTAASRIRASSA